MFVSLSTNIDFQLSMYLTGKMCKNTFWKWYKFNIIYFCISIFISKFGMQYKTNWMTFDWKWILCRYLIVMLSKAKISSNRTLCLTEGYVSSSLDGMVSVFGLKCMLLKHLLVFHVYYFMLFIILFLVSCLAVYIWLMFNISVPYWWLLSAFLSFSSS